MLNERIKELRTILGLSAEKFGSRVGVTRSAISRIENGVVNVTEQMILSICREFNVREEWLRNGNGEMFLDFTEDEFLKAANILSNDAFVRSLTIEYWKLDEDSKKLFRNFIHKLSDNMRSQEKTHSNTKIDIDSEVQKYHEELEMEVRQTEKLSVYESIADTNNTTDNEQKNIV